MDAAEEFASMQAMHPEAVLLQEGGRAVVFLPAFKFMAGGVARTMDLLLVPFTHSGYVTRLFFQQKIEGRGQNWNPHRVAEQNWWAPSWQNVPDSLRWTQMLLAHLRAVA